jgi:RNA-dependent RNA polymerase
MNEVFTRIKRTMINGISIGDRHFEFLAFGNSQFREHGAYFFAPLPHLTAQLIRAWMGYFGDIKIVAKHAARLGQCFSTTRAINCTRVEIRETQDVERNGYNFTDGVGKISNFLAQLITSELHITTVSGEPPSVFQFRLGGCKGVLAVSPDAKMREIHIRPSQYKFPAVHNGLEIIRWSQFAAATLNRQLILVLSALGVEDDVFVRKLKEMLLNLQQAMTDEKMALHLLQKYIDPNQMTMTVAAMILEGFQRTREPFVTSLLQLWRAWSIKYLKEKAKILIEKGAFLFGCVDETATLKGHFVDQQQIGPDSTDEEWVESLPQIFLQISARKPGGRASVIEGPCLLARNPSLHPGDIRVVRGVNVKALWHLKDVVVLPQTGDRDIASMCSGGDLDGDDYLVIWDPELFPKEWNHKPMDYTPPVPVEVEREVTVNDITNFFVTYMKNDRLPTIAHAHLALGDYMDLGVKDEKCTYNLTSNRELTTLIPEIGLKLASLHSMAVDYVKTGEPATMPSELHPRKWPHFMEKNHKPKEQIYVSHKVLGKLYDQVERIDFVPCFENPFDKRVLEAYKVDDELLRDAAAVKEQYDAAMRRIMAQHDIATEFEVWSTFVLHHANRSKDYKFHEEMGEISAALKDRFRQACYEKAGSKEFGIMGPFVAAMYRVTADEMALAIEECRQVKFVAGKEKRVRLMDAHSMPLMSFPWLFQNILGKIANGELYPTQAETSEVAAAVRATAKPTFKRISGDIQIPIPDVDDTVATTEGVTHQGEVLELFHHEGEQIVDSSDARKEDGGRESSGEEHPPKALTEEHLVAVSLDAVPDLKPVDAVGDVSPQTWEGLEELGTPKRVVELGPLINIEDVNTGLIDIGDAYPTANEEQVAGVTGSQSSSVNKRKNDLLADDADLEQFNIATSRGDSVSPHSAQVSTDAAQASEVSTNGSNGSSDAAIDDLLAEYRGPEESEKRETQSVEIGELMQSEADDEGQGEAEEVTFHIDPKESALELLARLVG